MFDHKLKYNTEVHAPLLIELRGIRNNPVQMKSRKLPKKGKAAKPQCTKPIHIIKVYILFVI